MTTSLTRVVVAISALIVTLAMPTTAAAAAPANDNFGDAITLSGPAGSVSGTNVDATTQPDECNWQCGPSVWYAWTSAAADPALVTFSMCDATFDSTMQVFTGTALGALTEVARDDDGCNSVASSVTFEAQPGVQYHLRIGGFSTSHVGPFVLVHPAGSVATPPSDTEAPVLTVPVAVYAVATSSSGATVTWTGVSATDAVDGAVTPNCTPPSGSSFPLGMSVVGCTAQDAAGNIATPAYFPVYVTYSWSDVLAPVNTAGDSVFKRGSTVPFKFRLTGYSAAITDATARISVAKYANSVLGDDVEATSTAAATSGNLFRYADGTYTFNLATKGLTRGTWRARIDLGDGVTHTVDFSLR